MRCPLCNNEYVCEAVERSAGSEANQMTWQIFPEPKHIQFSSVSELRESQRSKDSCMLEFLLLQFDLYLNVCLLLTRRSFDFSAEQSLRNIRYELYGPLISHIYIHRMNACRAHT